LSRGLLDLPAPLYAALDGWMAGLLSPSGRLILWAALGGILSVLLYRLLSPQARIAAAKQEVARTRQALDRHEGEFAEAMPLLKAQLGAAFRHIGLVLPATLIASLPVLTLLVWLDTAYGHAYPAPGEVPRLAVAPLDMSAEWRPIPGAPPRILVRAANGAEVLEVALRAPVTIIEKPGRWDWLIANPAGSLPEDGPVERVFVDLPERHYLSFGPDWLRSWLGVFLPALVIVSLAVHRLARVH
jgi:hypothetical protein